MSAVRLFSRVCPFVCNLSCAISLSFFSRDVGSSPFKCLFSFVVFFFFFFFFFFVVSFSPPGNSFSYSFQNPRVALSGPSMQWIREIAGACAAMPTVRRETVMCRRGTN